jgi:hypothetical protein
MNLVFLNMANNKPKNTGAYIGGAAIVIAAFISTIGQPQKN